MVDDTLLSFNVLVYPLVKTNQLGYSKRRVIIKNTRFSSKKSSSKTEDHIYMDLYSICFTPCNFHCKHSWSSKIPSLALWEKKVFSLLKILITNLLSK